MDAWARALAPSVNAAMRAGYVEPGELAKALTAKRLKPMRGTVWSKKVIAKLTMRLRALGMLEVVARGP